MNFNTLTLQTQVFINFHSLGPNYGTSARPIHLDRHLRTFALKSICCNKEIIQAKLK
jgi:hypothetical protein